MIVYHKKRTLPEPGLFTTSSKYRTSFRFLSLANLAYISDYYYYYYYSETDSKA